MTTKNLIILAGVAVVLGGAAIALNGGNTQKAPSLMGKKLLPAVKLADVTRIEIGPKLTLALKDDGWKIETLQNYPADASKITENLLKLTEQKVGQVVRGRKLGEETDVILKDATGKVLAEAKLGDQKRGRYAELEGQTVLVADSLYAFDGDPKKWCETRISSEPYVSWNSIVDEKEAKGLSSGEVYRVSYNEGTNKVSRALTVGDKVPDGTDRYCKMEGQPWVYTISSYAADSLAKQREEELKKKEAHK